MYSRSEILRVSKNKSIPMKWYICELPKVEAVSWERSIMLLSQIIF